MKNLSTEVVLNLKHYEKEAAKLNNHEKIFGFKATDYSSIRSSLKEIIPYQRFWKIVNLWKSELNSWRSMSL